MNLSQLRYFETLARLEHYTKAAKELQISQPTLSHAMSSLEQEMGAKLFRKQGRNVILTKYGKIFLEYVQESLHALDTGVSKVREMTGRTTGLIDLAFIYTMGREFVPGLVGDFLRGHEELDVRFRFTVGNTSEIIQGLKEEKFDVAFCSRVEGESEVEFTPVGEERLVVVVPKGHPLSQGRAVDLEEAAVYPQVYYTKSSGLRPEIDRLFERIHVKPKIAYEIEEDGSMAGLVSQNFGIAIMPDIPVLGNLEVDRIPLRSPRHHRYIYLAMAKNSYQTPMVERFAEYVKTVRAI